MVHQFIGTLVMHHDFVHVDGGDGEPRPGQEVAGVPHLQGKAIHQSTFLSTETQTASPHTATRRCEELACARGETLCETPPSVASSAIMHAMRSSYSHRQRIRSKVTTREPRAGLSRKLCANL